MVKINFLIYKLYSATCSGPKETECKSCIATYYRIFNAANNTCLCDEGYYSDSTASIC